MWAPKFGGVLICIEGFPDCMHVIFFAHPDWVDDSSLDKTVRRMKVCFYISNFNIITVKFAVQNSAML